MSQLIPEVDHAVINVDDQLDDAEALFIRMGFQLTARGHHSMGSSNHLAIFGDNYLELLGYEPDASDSTGTPKGLWQPPSGLVGLVWKTNDAGETYQHLEACQLAGEPPTTFFRPVTLPDGNIKDARFCITRIDASNIPNGFSFFCQHLTPDAVWQPVWQQHPNGVLELSEFVIVADDPLHAMQVYSRMFAPAHDICATGEAFYLQAGKTRLRFILPEQAKHEFIALPDDYCGQPRMSALEFTVFSLAQLRTCLTKGDVCFSELNSAIVVSPPNAFNVALRFRE
ncbi:VOC family protein [Ewingella sp. S1.OA.A_B6]